ncbi:EF-P lysine aminoacylase EpmA [Granulosicoccaceae sp. 1_MG-2023]|nr:EF-P lysine aminoacylase EpmA [Granulosicoccaceae sp. 1_MG-2023]
MTDQGLPSAGAQALYLRARLYSAIRDYFARQAVLEVETPVLSHAAVTDPAIHSFALPVAGQTCYLHTSPEFPMKRLLAAGSGDIYQICRVFRDGERGRNHNPEFAMLEWYRVGFDHHELMREVDDLLHQVWPGSAPGPSRYLSYAGAVRQATGFLPWELDGERIAEILRRHGTEPPDMGDDIDGWLDLLITHVVAPGFEPDCLTFIYDYPASQAALARVRDDGEVALAERFEVYYGERELGNGFHELNRSAEQRARFEADNAKREAQGLPLMPADERLLATLDKLPDCAGVAIGLDRLLMVIGAYQSIDEVLSFDFDRA